MSSLTASIIATPVSLPLVRSVRSEGRYAKQLKLSGPKLIGNRPIGLKPLRMQFQHFVRRAPVLYAARGKSPSIICAAALNSRCAAEQTQTVTREQSTITVAPIHGKEKSPELDDGGSGFPPRDDGDGGGGGGGGGGGWTGGFFFFGFLAFLGFLKDQESEGPYRDDRR